jgi:hypothetical protein
MTRLLKLVSLLLITQLFCGCYNQYDKGRNGEIFVSDNVYLNGKIISTEHIITLLKERKNDKEFNIVIINTDNKTRYKTWHQFSCRLFLV